MSANSMPLWQQKIDEGSREDVIDLRGCALPAEATRYLSDTLKDNKTTTLLALENTLSAAGWAEGMQDLCSLLEVNDTLTRVELDLNQLTDDHVREISDALKMNETVTVLSIRYNQITDDGIQRLIETIRENSTLENIYTGNNAGVSDEARQALQAAIKDVPQRQATKAAAAVRMVKSAAKC